MDLLQVAGYAMFYLRVLPLCSFSSLPCKCKTEQVLHLSEEGPCVLICGESVFTLLKNHDFEGILSLNIRSFSKMS